MTRQTLAALALAGALLAAGQGMSAGRAAPPTFAEHIAPLVFDRCGGCHRPGGPAPFSLLSYDEVRQRATLIAAVTTNRFMPPWKTEPGYGEFVGQHPLTDAEITLVQEWVAAGAPEGNPSRLPPRPRWTDGWQLGQPDLVATLPGSFSIPAGGADVFRIVVIPIPVTATRYIRGLEFRPGNARVVHHANIRVDRTPASRRLDEADPQPGYEGLLARSATYPEGHFFGWTPGQMPTFLPEGLAWRLDPGTDLVIQLHMLPSGRPEDVQPSVGLFFGTGPARRTPAMVRLGRQTIDIPPGEKRYVSADSYVLPVDVEVQAVQPHAHYRAREIRGTATLPDGTERWLIFIRDWDFRWQHVYRYRRPLALPKGTRLTMAFTYDNSAANPRNPQQPPERVRWGQRSFDEMGDLWLQVLTRNDDDLTALNGHFTPKLIAEDIAGYEMVIESSPSDAALHDDVALLYLELGRPGGAVRHFETSVGLKPDSAAAHFNLGTALTVAERWDEAVASYERALRLDPAYANAHNNLGSVLVSQGKLDQAVAHYRAALRVNPDHADAHLNLSRVLKALGQDDEARRHLREALRLKPGWPAALAELAKR